MNKIIVSVTKKNVPTSLVCQEAKSVLEALKYLAELAPWGEPWYKSGTEYYWGITEYKDGHLYEPLTNLNGHFNEYMEPIISNVHND